MFVLAVLLSSSLVKGNPGFSERQQRSVHAGELRSPDAELRNFVGRYCLACHGEVVGEADLRFDQLATDLEAADAVRTWTMVLDKVAGGQMPPSGELQPPPGELAQFTQQLSLKLHTESLARQQRDGRVVLRRLNRTEHETSLRDLFGPQVNIKELLPEENVSAGFDNVSLALDVSAAHLLRYQEAGELAVRSVLPRREPTPGKKRRTGRQITESVRTYSGLLGKSARLVDDTLMLYARPYNSAPCETPQTTEPGRYRVRASLYAVGTAGQPLPVSISRWGDSDRAEMEPRRVRDIPAGKPVVITEEFELDTRNKVLFTPWSLPSPREFASRSDLLPLDQYRGPGLAVEWVEIDGPLDEFPSAGYRRLFGDVPLKRRRSWDPNSIECAPNQPRDDAERLIRAFLPIAFRRPVSPTLARYFVANAHYELDVGMPFEEAMVVAYTAILTSPHFLYLVEPLRDDPLRSGESPSAEPIPTRTQLDDHALASRLSYFLWSSVPDAELIQLASENRLRERGVLQAQVERMLKDSKSRRFTDNFVGQWLDLREINATSPDPRIYGEFDDILLWSMPRETKAFFDEVLAEDLPVTDFVHSSWTFLNQRLAQHYGIAGVVGGELRKVPLSPESRRGGVMTQAAILKVTADGTRTSPIIRGVWVLNRIVGHEPPPPPPNLPAIEPDIRGATTIRQQLEKHRDSDACATCHQHIDPPGFALETFDPIGGWREFYRGTRQTRVALPNYPGHMVPQGMVVEMGGQMPDGRKFRDIDEYKKILLEDKDQLIRNLAQKLIVYATGADIQFADREVVEQLVEDSRSRNYGLRSLVHAIVQSRLFLYK